MITTHPPSDRDPVLTPIHLTSHPLPDHNAPNHPPLDQVDPSLPLLSSMKMSEVCTMISSIDGLTGASLRGYMSVVSLVIYLYIYIIYELFIIELVIMNTCL